MASPYMVSDEVRQFLTPVREFTLHNASDEPITIHYQGEQRTIPAINQVVYPHPKFEDVCHSCKDMDGDWVPGSLVLRDVLQLFMNGQEGQVWSAANAIRHALEIDVKSGVATGKYAERGISMLPPTPSKDMVRRVAEEGRRRFEAWRLKQAKEVLEAYETRIAALKSAGHAPIPLGPDYDRARAILEASREVERDKYKPLVAPAKPEPQAPLPFPIYQATETESEPVTDEQLANLIAGKIQAKSPALDAQALVSQLLSDPLAMKLLKTKYKVRKLRGSPTA